jgi:hypothetical protein
VPRDESPSGALDEAVLGFFNEVRVADLLLPDKWFGGRPFENNHELTHVTARPKRLIIELDDHLLLSFSGSPIVERVGWELVIRGYSQCVLEYLEYVNETPHAVVYDDGEVRFVAPQAAVIAP